MRYETIAIKPTMSFHMCGDAESKPEEKERAWENADCQDTNKKIKTFYIKLL